MSLPNEAEASSSLTTWTDMPDPVLESHWASVTVNFEALIADPVEAAKWAISALPSNLTSHPVDALAERLSQFSCLSSISHPVDASMSQSTNVRDFSDLRLAPVLTFAVQVAVDR